jgi:hypothetical protein
MVEGAKMSSDQATLIASSIFLGFMFMAYVIGAIVWYLF